MKRIGIVLLLCCGCAVAAKQAFTSSDIFEIRNEELYFALKARKVPAVLVRIPDEPHGIRGAHPSHRIAKMEYVLGWMEKWVNEKSDSAN